MIRVFMLVLLYLDWISIWLAHSWSHFVNCPGRGGGGGDFLAESPTTKNITPKVQSSISKTAKNIPWHNLSIPKSPPEDLQLSKTPQSLISNPARSSHPGHWYTIAPPFSGEQNIITLQVFLPCTRQGRKKKFSSCDHFHPGSHSPTVT